MESDDVLVDKILGDDLLLLDHSLDMGNLVADLCSGFEVEPLRLFFHSLSETGHQVLILPFEEHPHLMDHLPVAGRVDLFRARARHLPISKLMQGLNRLVNLVSRQVRMGKSLRISFSVSLREVAEG